MYFLCKQEKPGVAVKPAGKPVTSSFSVFE